MTTTCPTPATSPATTEPVGSLGRAPLGVPIGLVVLLGSLQALGPVALDTYLPALPTIADELGTSTSSTQLTLTATLAGLALGQLAFGSLSDAMGRRRPLLAGSALFVVASLACALAPSIEVLLVMRFVLGLGAAAGMVSAMAIARDSSSGTSMARLFAALMLVTGVAPVLAPVIGGQLLLLTSWRGIFALLAGMGVVLLLAAATRLPETLPAHRRQGGGLARTTRTYGRLLRDRTMVLPLLTLMLGCAGLFGYLAGSPFLLQDVHGLSPQAYSAVFAVNCIGLTALSQLSGRIVHRTGPAVLLQAGTLVVAVGGLLLLAATVLDAGLLAVLPALFLLVSGMGLIFPNATTLALSGQGATAGSAAALLGLGQFGAGAFSAPLVGLGADPSLSMAVVLAVVSVGSVVAGVAATRPSADRGHDRTDDRADVPS